MNHDRPPTDAPEPSDTRDFELLDDVLGHLDRYGGTPDDLVAHLRARGHTGRPSVLRTRAARLFDLARDLYGAALQDAVKARQPFGVYYGQGRIDVLARFDTVVVQPEHHDDLVVRDLVRGGTRVLAYVSLGEDGVATDEPWHLPSRNLQWNTRYVRPNDQRWTRQVRERIEGCSAYSGFFLDTIEMVDVHPEARADMLTLLGRVRRWAPDAYLLANRGFSLLPHLAKLVNGVLIESFSTTWLDGYRKLDPQGLDFTAAMKTRVDHARLDVYGLDYAVTPTLTRFARQRAARLGVPTFVTTRDLHTL